VILIQSVLDFTYIDITDTLCEVWIQRSVVQQ